MNVNKGVIIGIVVSGIVIGIFVGLSFGSFSIIEGKKSPNSEIEEKNDENESKPQGRNLSLEFDEKMGLSAP